MECLNRKRSNTATWAPENPPTISVSIWMYSLFTASFNAIIATYFVMNIVFAASPLWPKSMTLGRDRCGASYCLFVQSDCSCDPYLLGMSLEFSFSSSNDEGIYEDKKVPT